MLCFVTASRSENRYLFQRAGMKTGVEYDIFLPGGRGAGNSAYERSGDARRLA